MRDTARQPFLKNGAGRNQKDIMNATWGPKDYNSSQKTQQLRKNILSKTNFVSIQDETHDLVNHASARK